ESLPNLANANAEPQLSTLSYVKSCGSAFAFARLGKLSLPVGFAHGSKATGILRLCRRSVNRRLEADGHYPLAVTFDPQAADMDRFPGVRLVHASHDHRVAEIK